MAIDSGRLEGRITVPTGGWTAYATGDGGSADATIAAGTYYLSTLITTFKTALDTATGDTWTVSIANGEVSTGLCTISVSGATGGITWDGTTPGSLATSTDLRDALGFEGDGNLTGTSNTSTDSCKMLWLPDAPIQTPFGAQDDGFSESDARATESPGGHVKVVQGSRKTVLNASWTGISHARCRIAAETTGNQSFEQFWQDVIQGEGPGGTPGGPIRLYWDADAANFTAYAVVGEQLNRFTVEQLTEGHLSWWRVPLNRLVKVP